MDCEVTGGRHEQQVPYAKLLLGVGLGLLCCFWVGTMTCWGAWGGALIGSIFTLVYLQTCFKGTEASLQSLAPALNLPEDKTAQ